MNPEAFMLLDRLEKLMCSPQSQHPSNPFLGPVASMSRGWKGTLLKFGGEVGEGRVHLEDTFSVPLGSFQSGWPTSPTLWPDSLSIRVPSVCALTGPPWPLLSLWIFLRCAYREACGGASLNVLLPFVNQSEPRTVLNPRTVHFSASCRTPRRASLCGASEIVSKTELPTICGNFNLR